MIIDNLSLLAEHDMERDFELITEQNNPNEKKKVYIQGPYMVANVINKNNRVYLKEAMEEAADVYRKEYIDKRIAGGELNHPSRSSVDPERTVHRVLELNQKDNVWIGKSIMMEGIPLADMVITQMSHGMALGVSTRGGGRVTTKDWNGHKDIDVVDKFSLVAFDVVTDPSGTYYENGSKQHCYVDGILESKKFMIDEHGDLVEQAYDKFENTLANLSVRNEQKRQIINSAIHEFLEGLR